MDNASKIFVFTVMTLFFVGAFLAFGSATAAAGGVGGEPRYKYTVSGELSIGAFGFGEASFKEGYEFKVEECGFFDNLGSIWGVSAESGDLELYVDGVLQKSINWDSTVGEDVPFTMKSGVCKPASQCVEVLLLDDDGVAREKISGGSCV